MGSPPRNSDSVMLNPCKQLCLIYAKVSMTGPNPSHQHLMVSDTAYDGSKETIGHCFNINKKILIYNLHFVLLFSYIPIFRGLCPQGVMSAGVFIQGAMSAGGFIQGVMSAGGFIQGVMSAGDFVLDSDKIPVLQCSYCTPQYSFSSSTCIAIGMEESNNQWCLPIRHRSTQFYQ